MLVKRLLTLLVLWFAGSVHAMTFIVPKHDIVDVLVWTDKFGMDKVRIYASGEIEEGDAEVLERLAEEKGITDAMVLLDSDGGSLLGAMALGKVIRQHRFDTSIATYNDGKMEVAGICASACAYVFAGGINRYYVAKRTRLGLHQFSSRGERFSSEATQVASGILVEYLSGMGIDARAFSVSALAMPDEMNWLTADQAAALNLANNGVRPPTSEIKLLNGVPYLKVEQTRHNIMGRLLFVCNGKNGVILQAGIVTDPENTNYQFQWATQSYLTLDSKVSMRERKSGSKTGLKKVDSVLWVNRYLNQMALAQVVAASELGVWVAADGMVKFGTSVSLWPVREKLQSFLTNCH